MEFLSFFWGGRITLFYYVVVHGLVQFSSVQFSSFVVFSSLYHFIIHTDSDFIRGTHTHTHQWKYKSMCEWRSKNDHGWMSSCEQTCTYAPHNNSFAHMLPLLLTFNCSAFSFYLSNILFILEFDQRKCASGWNIHVHGAKNILTCICSSIHVFSTMHFFMLCASYRVIVRMETIEIPSFSITLI